MKELISVLHVLFLTSRENIRSILEFQFFHSFKGYHSFKCFKEYP